MDYLEPIICLSLSVLVFAEDNPVPYITKCESDDTGCITASTNALIKKFADGIPEADVEKIDPLLLEKIDASTPNLKFIVDGAEISGLRNCVAEKIERSLEKSKLYIAIQCTATFSSDYVMKGKLLTLTMEAESKMKIILRKILINADIDLEEYEKNKKKHWRIKKWVYNFELKDKSDIDLGNFTAGNDVLGKAVKDLIADNGNQIIMDLCPPILKATVAKVLNNVNKLFKYASLDNLIII